MEEMLATIDDSTELYRILDGLLSDIQEKERELTVLNMELTRVRFELLVQRNGIFKEQTT
jgi:hypothetical protein